MTNRPRIVRLTPAADRDIDDILDYAIANGPIAEATALIDELLDKAQSLARFPDRGPVPEELARIGEHRYRQLNHRQFRIIYRRIADTVTIFLIADGRRDMVALLTQRLTSA